MRTHTKTIINLTVIGALACISIAAYAEHLPSFGAPNDNVIHTTTVNTEGKTILARATLKIGTGEAGSCNLTQLAGQFLYDFTDGTQVPVGGQFLAHFGLDYTCAQETYEPLHGNQPVSIQYKLVSDKEKGIYTKAEPDQQEVKLSPQR